MNSNNNQLNLIILIISIVLVYIYYPEYANIIAPLFIAISLYYSTNDQLMSALPDKLNTNVIQYKQYILAGLIILSGYFIMDKMNKNKKTSSTIIVDLSDISNISDMSNMSGISDISGISGISKNVSNLSDLDLPDVSSSFLNNNYKLKNEF
jgi:hypothetical protein